MAKMNTSGIDDIYLQIAKLGDKSDKAVDKMLNAGADVVVEAQKKEIKQRFSSDRSTGGLAKSIKKGKVKKKNGVSSIDIKPNGKDKRGESYAKIGNVLEYGRSNMPANPWMSSANIKSDAERAAAMRKAWDEEMSNG